MAGVDFEDLLEQADRLRDGAQVTAAISGYLDIAKLATDDHEAGYRARALHLAGLSASLAIKNRTSSYYRDALTYFRQAEELYLALGDRPGLGALHRDMAKAADRAGDYPAALGLFQKAIEELTDTPAFGELAITYDKLGLHYYRLNQLETARKFIAQALKLFTQEPTSGFFRATTLLDSAKVEFRLGQFEKSLDLATESLSWFEAEHPGKNYTQRLAQLYGMIAVIYGELDDRKKSEQFFERYQTLLKNFDPLAIEALEGGLRNLAS